MDHSNQVPGDGQNPGLTLGCAERSDSSKGEECFGYGPPVRILKMRKIFAPKLNTDKFMKFAKREADILASVQITSTFTAVCRIETTAIAILDWIGKSQAWLTQVLPSHEQFLPCLPFVSWTGVLELFSVFLAHMLCWLCWGAETDNDCWERKKDRQKESKKRESWFFIAATVKDCGCLSPCRAKVVVVLVDPVT